MSHYKVTYFNIKGLGEPIRLILSYMGKDFEDNRITHEQWADLKGKTPFGKLPLLEVDGKLARQSSAICRYLGKQAGLTGKTEWEDLEIDMAVGSMYDLVTDVTMFFRAKDEKTKSDLQKTLVNETIPFYLDLFEKEISKNGYIANGKLSWADFFFVAYTETLEMLMKDEFIGKRPTLKAHRTKVMSIPNVKKWVDKRPKTM